MWALVGRLGLGSDDRDATVELRVTETGRDGVAGGTGADDYSLRSNSRNLRSDQTRYPPRTETANA